MTKTPSEKAEELHANIEANVREVKRLLEMKPPEMPSSLRRMLAPPEPTQPTQPFVPLPQSHPMLFNRFKANR